MNQFFNNSFELDQEENLLFDGYKASYLKKNNYCLMGGRCDVYIIENLADYLIYNEYIPSYLSLALSSVQAYPDITEDEAYDFWKTIENYDRQGILDEEFLSDVGYVIAGKIAFISSFDIEEEHRNRALYDILNHLKENELVDYVLLSPSLVQKSYQKIGFKMTKGEAQTMNGTQIPHMVLKL